MIPLKYLLLHSYLFQLLSTSYSLCSSYVLRRSAHSFSPAASIRITQLFGLSRGLGHHPLHSASASASSSAFGFSHLLGLTRSTRISAKSNLVEVLSNAPKVFKQIYPSIIERARTIPNVCVSGTLCTTSNSPGIEGSPFGTSIDYITDEKGWPILLMNEGSEHSNNIKLNPRVSLYCQLPTPQYYGEIPSALGKVTIVGDIIPINKREEVTYKCAFPLVHPHTEALVQSSKYFFRKLRPARILYTGGYGVMSSWVNTTDYEKSTPDNLALEIPRLLPRINLEKEKELRLVCRHFLQLEKIESVKVLTIDRLGLDLRVQTDGGINQYRIAFRYPVVTIEDAKSELLKLFQECWEREHHDSPGRDYYPQCLPDVLQYNKNQLGDI